MSAAMIIQTDLSSGKVSHNSRESASLGVGARVQLPGIGAGIW